MTDADYDRWVNRHSSLFGFCHHGDPATFKAWRAEFERRRISIGELESATSEMAGLGEALKWRDQHLAYINAHVSRLRRLDMEKRRLAEPEGPSKCADCGGQGLMVVPHWKCVADGAWDGQWVTIGCHCFAGRGLQDRYNRLELNDSRMARFRPMTFERYCDLNPDFRAQARDYGEHMELARKSQRAAQGQDATAGPLSRVIDRVARRA